MPIRLYRCPRGHEEEVAVLSADQYPKTKPCFLCTDTSKNVPAPFAGKVGTKSVQEKALNAQGLIPYEAGLESDARKNREYAQEKHFARLTAAVEDVVRHDTTIRPD